LEGQANSGAAHGRDLFSSGAETMEAKQAMKNGKAGIVCAIMTRDLESKSEPSRDSKRGVS
jgi:hypothetical protein